MFVPSGVAWGQQLLYRSYDRSAGLPSDYVFDIRQDRRGYLWFATDRGVVRYDGRAFELWNTSRGMRGALVYRLAEDSRGGIWAATFEGGLNHIGHDSARNYSAGEGQLNESTFEVAVDGNDVVYCTGSAGLVASALKRSAQGRELVPSGGWVLDTLLRKGTAGMPMGLRRGGILRVSSGQLWHTRLVLGRLQTRQLAVRDSTGAHVLIKQLLEAPGGTLLDDTCWAMTEAGVVRLVLTERGAQARLERPVRWQAQSAARAPDGWLALGDHEHGLELVLDAGQRSYTAARGGLPVNYVNCVSFDREGNLWVGTFGGGALRLLAPQALWLSAADGLPDAQITVVSVDPTGDTWVGTPAGYARVAPDGRVVLRGQLPGARAEDQQVRALAHGPDGTHYIASFSTLHRLRAGGERAVLGRSSSGYADLGWGPKGLLWVASYGSGLECYSPLRPNEGVKQAPVPASSAMLEAVFAGSNGNLWVASAGNGVDWTDGTTVHHLGPRDGLMADRQTAVYEDVQGRQWFGSGQGVTRRDAKGWRHYPSAGQMLGNTVLCVFEDVRTDGAAPTLFAVTEAALHRYNPQTDAFDPIPAFTLRPDGRTSINRAVYDRARRRLLVGTTRGLIIRDMKRVPRLPEPLPVVVQAVVVDSVTRRLHPLEDSTVVLEPGVSRLTVRYAGLSFTDETSVRYRTRLIGLENRWSAATDAREVTYRNLPSGTYWLAVQVLTPTGQVGPEHTVLRIEQTPPLYARWYVVLPLLALAVWGLIGVGRVITQQRLMRRIRALEMEKRVQAERERISRDLHDHVGAQLTSLVSGLELTERVATADPKRHSELLTTLKADARATIGQLRETIWALHQEAVSVGGFAEKVEQYAEGLMSSHARPKLEIRCEPETLATAELSPTEALQLFRIAQEAIHNAFKYAEAERLWVVLSTAPGCLLLTVADDGKGLPDVLVNAEGKLHSNVNGYNNGMGGGGYGLMNMRKRAAELGGTAEIGRHSAQGTAVRVCIPWVGATGPGR